MKGIRGIRADDLIQAQPVLSRYFAVYDSFTHNGPIKLEAIGNSLFYNWRYRI